MYWTPEAGESALLLVNSILTTALYSVFRYSLKAGENFMEVLHILATMLHFFKRCVFRILP